MRYLLNLSLAAAAIVGWGAVHFTLLSNRMSSGDASVGPAFAMVVSIGLLILLLAGVLIGCAMSGSFKWLPAEGGSAVAIVLVAYAALIAIALLPIGIAMEGKSAVPFWGIDQLLLARIVAAGLPIALGLYAGWVINAPEALRDNAPLRLAALGVVAVFCLAAGSVSVREMAQWNVAAAERAVARAEEVSERVQEQRRGFAALTDADTLLAWDQYVSANSPPDVRAEAARRIAARPSLEADLAEALASENSLWQREALRLIEQLPFAPSPRLEAPVRGALTTIAEELRQQAGVASPEGDRRLDYYEPSTLRAALAVTRRMAESAGVDLGDALDTMRRAVALYPTAEAAHGFPRQVADAKRDVAAALARRKGQ